MSGMYLGEIVRRVILRISQESDLFGPDASKLLTPFILRYLLAVLFYILISKPRRPLLWSCVEDFFHFIFV